MWDGSSTICPSEHFKKIIDNRQILRQDVSVSISISVMGYYVHTMTSTTTTVHIYTLLHLECREDNDQKPYIHTCLLFKSKQRVILSIWFGVFNLQQCF